VTASVSVSQLYAHLRELRLLDRVYIPSSVVLASLAAAACYAIASVLQQAEAAKQGPELALRPALLRSLAHRPGWLLGNLASIVGYGFQFLALRHGALALVEPLLVCSLVLALPLGGALQHRRLTRREWAPGLLIVAALALFLAAARPGAGAPRASTTDWVVLAVITVAVVAAVVRAAGPSGPRRALALGAGAGVLYGVTGAVTETTGHLLDHGIAHVLSSWAPYALVVAAVAGLLLNQSAFQAGELRWSLPVMTILEPLVAIAIGEFMFGEHIAGGALARSGEIVALAGMVFGVFALSGPWLAHQPAG
jgi:drug/metabolite transporter (DMT)-like permease